MITEELKAAILDALKLDNWEITDSTLAGEVPGWDSLNHVNVMLCVEKRFGIRFKSMEVLRLTNVGDLQRLVSSKLAQQSK